MTKYMGDRKIDRLGEMVEEDPPFVKVTEWARSWHPAPFAALPKKKEMPLILICEASSASVTGKKSKSKSRKQQQQRRQINFICQIAN